MRRQTVCRYTSGAFVQVTTADPDRAQRAADAAVQAIDRVLGERPEERPHVGPFVSVLADLAGQPPAEHRVMTPSGAHTWTSRPSH